VASAAAGFFIWGTYMFEKLTPQEAQKIIQHKARIIERLYQEIRDIATANIEDFHFLDYQVSNFWTCDKSPIGMCVFILNEGCRPTNCRYCHGPTERK
jgi:hypothetical protein